MLTEEENVNEVQRGKYKLEHEQSLQELRGYMINLGLLEQCKMWTGKALKTSQFNCKWKCSVTGLHSISRKSVWQCCRESVFCQTSGRHILQNEKMDKAKRSVEYPSRSPDFIPLDFYLCGDLKDIVCTRKPRTLQDLRHRKEVASVATPSATLREVCHCCTLLSTVHWGC
jgi:hypothetical protein